MHNFKGKLDEKNRLTIPADVRRELGSENVYITPGFNITPGDPASGTTIHLYPESTWRERMEKGITANPEPDNPLPTIMNQRLAAQIDYFLSDLQVTTVDARGRITLEPDLVGIAGLDANKAWKAVRVQDNPKAGHYWRIRRADRRPQI